MAITRQQRQAEKEALAAELKDRFAQRLRTVADDPDAWSEMLNEVADWGARYSIGNQLALIHQLDKRGITDPRYFMARGTYAKKTETVNGKSRQVDDFTRPLSGWAKAGYQIRKDERAFWIFSPRPVKWTPEEAAAANARGRKVTAGEIKYTDFSLTPTYELSQMELQPGYEPFVVPTLVDRRRELVGAEVALLTGEDPTGAYDDAVKLIIAEGYSFQVVPRGTGPLASMPKANGITCYEPNEVAVADDLEPAQRVKTAVHELAHIRLDHRTRQPKRPQKETEAESVAHIVCGVLGLPTHAYTDAYVLGWAGGDMKLIESTMKLVLKTAQRILKDLDPAE